MKTKITAVSEILKPITTMRYWDYILRWHFTPFWCLMWTFTAPLTWFYALCHFHMIGWLDKWAAVQVFLIKRSAIPQHSKSTLLHTHTDVWLYFGQILSFILWKSARFLHGNNIRINFNFISYPGHLGAVCVCSSWCNRGQTLFCHDIFWSRFKDITENISRTFFKACWEHSAILKLLNFMILSSSSLCKDNMM